MPIKYIRRLTGRRRTADANRHLGFTLAFVAGAINAGGFLLVHKYTSHMTGIVSSMADNSVLGAYDLVLKGAGAVMFFLLGAACSAILINYSRRSRLHSEFAIPLMLEAALLMFFGAVGNGLSTVDGLFVSSTVMLLCFIMGLQNAVITKISKAEIRTTHITGIITDIGIELGKLFYWNVAINSAHPKILANRPRLRTLTGLAASFFLGGIAGAYGFKHVGYISTLPLAIILSALAMVPVMDDVSLALRHRKRKRRLRS